MGKGCPPSGCLPPTQHTLVPAECRPDLQECVLSMPLQGLADYCLSEVGGGNMRGLELPALCAMSVERHAGCSGITTVAGSGAGAPPARCWWLSLAAQYSPSCASRNDAAPCCSGVVYRAVFNGETVAAKMIDIGLSAEVQEAFITVGEARLALQPAWRCRRLRVVPGCQ